MQPVNVPGFGDQAISVQMSNGFTPIKLFVNGQPAPPGPKRGQCLLRRADGVEVIASFKPKFPDPIPVLVIEGQQYPLAAPLRWYQWVWAALPILLLAGGAIGGGLGAGAIMLNAQILRSNQPVVARYLLSGAVTFVSFVLLLLLVTLLHRALPPAAVK